MKKIKTVLILAGGKSDRFWPLENKNYWQFLGKPALEWQIENYSLIAERIILVENIKNQTRALNLVARLNKVLSSKITLVFQKDNCSGQAGAIISAEELLEGEVLIVNANDFYDSQVPDQFVEKINQKQPDLFFLVNKTKEYFPGGYLKFEGNRIIGIIEKPNQDNLPSDMIKLVVDYVKDVKRLIAYLKEINTDQDNHYELGLNKYLAKSSNNEYLIYDKSWSSLKYPWHILTLTQYYLRNLKKSMIGRNVQISPTAKIVGTCYIGDNTVIGDYSLVINSHIGADCLIGGYCEVTRSYLGNQTMLHRNYVGDSVLADGVLMGAGAVTANYRFDKNQITSTVKNNRISTNLIKFGAVIGSNSKIGVNSTLLPGVKIGSNTYVAPASVINQDIEDKVYFSQGNKKNNQLL